jgi:hypothetical protein
MTFPPDQQHFDFSQQYTIISRPYTTISIAEPTIDYEMSGFVYNYYTADERLPYDQQNKFSINDYLSAEDFNAQFQTIDNQKRLPRFNHIVFKSNHAEIEGKFSENLDLGTSVLIDNFEARIQNGTDTLRPDRIISEGTFANAFFNSTTLIDTNLDKAFYYVTNHQLGFFEATQQVSPEDQSLSALQQRVDAYVNRTDQHEDNPQIVRQFVNQLKISGQDMLNSIGISEEDKFMTSVRNQSFLMGFNNLHIDNIIAASNDEVTSVFDDELRAMRQFTPQVQSRAVEILNPEDISIENFQNIFGLGFLHDFSIDNTELTTPTPNLVANTLNPPHIRHLGFVLNKREIDFDGNVTNYPAKFIGQKSLTEIIDDKVVYGYNYLYKLKAVSAVEYDFIVKSSVTHDFVKLRGLFFIGSRPSTIQINAIENIPPRPPTHLRFNYQRNNGLLIDWDAPINPQNDIVAYLVYRRENTSQSFKLIKELNFDMSKIKTTRKESAYIRNTLKYNGPVHFYEDKEFNQDSQYIYAVVSVDAHGMTSSYSPQYGLSYNRPTNSIIVNTVSKSQAPKAYPNMFMNGILAPDGKNFNNDNLSDFMKDVVRLTGKKRMTVYFNPEYYHVFKKTVEENSGITEEELNITTENLKLFQASTGDGEPIYRIHLMNTDLQLDNVVDITINDISTRFVENPLSVFEENNFSFDLLHPEKYQ